MKSRLDSLRGSLVLVCSAALTASFLIWGAKTLLGYGGGAGSGCSTRVSL